MSLGAAHERARQIAELRIRRVISLSAGRKLRKLNAARRIPHQAWPRAARLSYTLQLRTMLDDLERAIEQQWLPVIAPWLRLDAGSPSDISQLSIPDLLEQVIPKTRALRIARSVAEKTSALNKAAVNTQFRAVLGVDAVVHEPYLEKQLELFAVDNARLITALATDVANAAQGIALRALRSDGSVDEVRTQVQARFDKARDSADELSRVEVGRFNGELTQARQQAVGVTEYDWDTSHDERVRPDHAELDGTRQSWDDPPIADQRSGFRAHPGGCNFCRCAAIPVMDDLLASLSADESAAAE